MRGTTNGGLEYDCIIAKGHGNLTIANAIEPDSEDQFFIAHAREDIPRLLDMIVELEATIMVWRC